LQPTRIPKPKSGAKPHKAEVVKTWGAIDGLFSDNVGIYSHTGHDDSGIVAVQNALRAIQTALIRSRTLPEDCSSSPNSSEDCASLCGTECTESTVCSSSFSEDCKADDRRASLRDARRTLKERTGAEERSARFARGLLVKLDELRVAMTEGSFEVA